jgi:hypothetical protein
MLSCTVVLGACALEDGYDLERDTNVDRAADSNQLIADTHPIEHCCSPADEPGQNGNAICFEGATCCGDGTWQCNSGDGSNTCANSTGAVGDVCSEPKCCDLADQPGTNGNPFCFEGASCCGDGTWQCNSGNGSSTCGDVGGGAICEPQPSACDIVLCPANSVCSEDCDGNAVCNPIICEGFAGLQCQPGFECKLASNDPDVGGKCERNCAPDACGPCVSDDDCGNGYRCTAAEVCLISCECPECDVCAGECVPDTDPPVSDTSFNAHDFVDANQTLTNNETDPN